ncbi:MAG: hypothetical protein ACP5LX_01630 [Nitrososphaeria archaeon]|jgi:hypothetical protein
MFKVASSGWEKLDKEILRMKEENQVSALLSVEVVPAQENIDLQKELKNASTSTADLCEFETDIHEDHGALNCQKLLEDGFSDVLKDVINRVNSLGTLFVAGFQAEIYRDQDLIMIMFGDSYNATVIYPHESGKKLEVMQLEFTI